MKTLEQLRVDLIAEELGLTFEEKKELNENIGALVTGGLGVADYYDLRKRGYTHLEAIAKAAMKGVGGLAGGTLGAIGGGGVGSLATGAAGGIGGYYGGGWLYDKLTGRVNGRVPGSKATLGGKPVVWSKEGKWEPAGAGAEVETETETEVQPDPEKVQALQQGTDETPVETARQLYQQQAQSRNQQQQDPEDAGETQQQAAALTPMQQWAKAHPQLAAKVKPGQAGYDEIQKMGQGNKQQPAARQSSSETASPSIQTQQNIQTQRKEQEQAAKRAAQKQQQAPTQQTGSQLGSDAGVRAASRLRDYSQKMNNANQGSRAFSGLPEEYKGQMLDEIALTLDELYLQEGVDYLDENALGRAAKVFPWMWKFLRTQAPKGYKWVVKNGKRVLEKVKGKGAQAADDVVKPPVKTKPSKAGLVDKNGNPLQVPQTPKVKPPKIKNSGKPNKGGKGVKNNKPAKPNKPPKAQPPKAGGNAVGNAAKRLAGTAMLGGAGYLAYRHRDKLAGLFGGGGDSDSPGSDTPGTDTPGTETQTPQTQQPTVEPKGPTNVAPEAQAQVTPDPVERERNRSSWIKNKPVGRDEMLSANQARRRNSKWRREEFDPARQMLEARKDEEGMSPDQKSIGRSIKAGMNPLTDHMAGATRQRLHLANRGKKKPVARSNKKETRLPAQQLKAMQNEQQALRDLTDSLFEGLPEPKVNYLKDMDPYDPRRAPRDHAPGSPLPPASLRPGIPDFLKRASKDKKKDTKKA